MSQPHRTIAVILSGCGVQDGSEIHEAVLTLLALDRAGASYQCLAPNIPQTRVVNHATGAEVSGETRNVLQESARIARGQILDIAQAQPADYAAMIFPGGFGAALNLSDFGSKQDQCQVEPSVLEFAEVMAASGKPAGFICIAPALIPRIYGSGIKLTIGNDPDTAQTLEKMGVVHVECPVTNCIVDKQRKVVSTPAYMLAQSIQEAAAGIEQLVQKVLALC
ncbi:Enhancing lycopene biosynthesis protein 2 [Candidatus Glomeribacter gigasporarum BEG34]|uniref:Enhancing lycopene biosynthesis protein 2 n=1 Tax=Candidatus Glomeribacter gigasporarum BEG34 TaxID=1070319 RepID=G2JC29_9BURK|nr:isoprenoid biosynthesis glyoxalase ElbB [Candidatus Glomeribacter gigasporarum]CCD30335.1 Enhancing lycopene biosynthesis protein 2 [Candidatus Glomeribacter gigasporarum BEG34]